jgi:alkane 1-monooxygenase
MAAFALISLTPFALFMAGASGGAWIAAGLVWMTLLTATLDQVLPRIAPDAPEGTEFPAADALLVAIGVAHLAGFPLVLALAVLPGDLTILSRLGLCVGFGLWVGQVAVPAAHELIHRGDRRLFWLGAAVYGSILFGHHASAHRLVHHRHAASREDPNTARRGEGYYRFFLRAWAGSFRAGYAAESALRKGRGLHPYAAYAALGAAALAVAGLAGGLAGVAVWAAVSLHAQSQLLLSDYVQHYGLTRATLPGGRLEPVGDRHSWNAPHWFSSGLMLNAPRHSDHHAHPSRPYPALRLPPPSEAPHLPYALPVSCVIALVPPLWRRMMHPRLAAWRS